MRKLLFVLSFVGLLAGCVVAYVSGITQPPLPPAFNPPTNPYPNGIYAEGMVESDQPSGENINIYPEVSGTVKQILVAEGQEVKKGTVLLVIDDSIQRATVEQLESQAQAAFTLLEELKAQPRKETLDVAEAQVVSAQAALKTAQDELDKQQAAYDLNPKSISKDALDSAANAVATAKANLEVARKQRDLTKAGAWIYDINNQERTYNALYKSYLSASALLSKYTLRAPRDGIVLAINPTVGSFVSDARRLRHVHAGHGSGAGAGKPSRALERALLRGRNSGAAASQSVENEGSDVGAGIHGQDSARLCPDAAHRISENRAFRSEAGAGGCAACCRSSSGWRNPRN